MGIISDVILDFGFYLFPELALRTYRQAVKTTETLNRGASLIGAQTQAQIDARLRSIYLSGPYAKVTGDLSRSVDGLKRAGIRFVENTFDSEGNFILPGTQRTLIHTSAALLKLGQLNDQDLREKIGHIVHDFLNICLAKPGEIAEVLLATGLLLSYKPADAGTSDSRPSITFIVQQPPKLHTDQNKKQWARLVATLFHLVTNMSEAAFLHINKPIKINAELPQDFLKYIQQLYYIRLDALGSLSLAIFKHPDTQKYLLASNNEKISMGHDLYNNHLRHLGVAAQSVYDEIIALFDLLRHVSANPLALQITSQLHDFKHSLSTYIMYNDDWKECLECGDPFHLGPLTPVNQVRGLVEKVSASQLVTSRNNRITIKVQVTPRTAAQHLILTKAKLLDRMLSELVLNAVKYFDPDKPTREVQLRATTNRKNLVFQVQDNGLGMSADQVEKLGTIGYRAEHIRHLPGSGLGIASVFKEIVETFQGQYKVNSTPKIGTEITLLIPKNQILRTEEQEDGIAQITSLNPDNPTPQMAAASLVGSLMHFVRQRG